MAEVDPLTGKRDWLIAALLFAFTSIAYTWYAIPPARFTEMVQSHDALLAAAISSHTSRAIFGKLPFWELGIFYPLKDTLCLSEPMITGAVLTVPIERLLGYVAASNAYAWICFWTTAMAAWAFLRNRGISWLAAFWGAFYISCCPDHITHLLGHTHLYFHAGFALVPLALERAIRPGSSRAWSVVFGAALLAQVLSGMYMTVFFGLWCLFVVPASIYYASGGDRQVLIAALKRQGPQFAAWTLLTALLFLPVAHHYSRFGRQFPQVTLEVLQKTRATWEGYLIPLTEDGRGMTIMGTLYQKYVGESVKGENEQYIGIPALLLLSSGIVLAIRKSRRFKSIARRDLVFISAVLLAGLLALIFSLGPFYGDGYSRKPYAFVFAWFSPIRFIRALPRFAFIVEWSIALLGAFVLDALIRLMRTRRKQLLLALPILAFTMIEFLPIHRSYMYPASEDDFTRYIKTQDEFPPFASFPPKQPSAIMRLGYTHVPITGGFSGYAPQNRDPELYFMESYFPRREALMMLPKWGVWHLFVEKGALDRMADSSGLRELWRGEAGVFYELPGDLPSAAEYRLERMQRENIPAISTPLVFFRQMVTPIAMQRAGVRIAGEQLKVVQGVPLEAKEIPGPTIYIVLQSASIHPQQFGAMRMRLKVDNWFAQNETGTLYWSSESQPFHSAHSYEFTIPADGRTHEIVLNLGEYIPWIASGRINLMRLDLGRRINNVVFIETLELLPAEKP